MREITEEEVKKFTEPIYCCVCGCPVGEAQEKIDFITCPDCPKLNPEGTAQQFGLIKDILRDRMKHLDGATSVCPECGSPHIVRVNLDYNHPELVNDEDYYEDLFGEDSDWEDVDDIETTSTDVEYCLDCELVVDSIFYKEYITRRANEP